MEDTTILKRSFQIRRYFSLSLVYLFKVALNFFFLIDSLAVFGQKPILNFNSPTILNTHQKMFSMLVNIFYILLVLTVGQHDIHI